MGFAARNIEISSAGEIVLGSYPQTVAEARKPLFDSLPAKQAIYIGLFLAFLQLLDGVLTLIGVSRFGASVEGNPLLRILMVEFGYVTTLSAMKLAAIVMVGVLTFATRSLPWIKDAMAAIAGIYIVAAIAPWTYILLSF